MASAVKPRLASTTSPGAEALEKLGMNVEAVVDAVHEVLDVLDELDALDD